MKFKASNGINQRIDRITNKHLVVGIDIAKETHVAAAVNFRGREIGRKLSFSNNRTGFERLLQWVDRVQKTEGLTDVIFGMEATGHYFMPLADWLSEKQFETVLVSPMTTKRNKENRDNRQSKSDAKDAVVIADSVARGFYSSFVKHEPIYRKLRALVNEREALGKDLAAKANQIQTALDELFPEFTAVFKEWNCPRAIATLQAFPSPAELKLLTVEQVIHGWREQGMRRAGGSTGLEKAAQLLAAARSSVGIAETASEMKRRIARLVDSYLYISKQIEEVEREIVEQLGQVPEAAIRPLREMRMSPLLSAIILANSGDLRRYTHGNQLLALAGLSLVECSSGKRRGQVVLSKRGRSQLRKYLFLAVIALVSHHEAFRGWHEYNVEVRKLKKQRSIFKLIGKFARILVALAHSGDNFQAEKAAALTPGLAA